MLISFVETNAKKKIMCYYLNRGEDNMPGYVLVEDILDEMTQNISYIKLKSYFKERKK